MPTAAISAAGSVAGGLIQGKSAAKVAKIQQKTAEDEIAATKAMYDSNKSLIMPTVTNGQTAQTQQMSLLGLGGDPTSAEATLQATPGYQYSVSEALKGINSNAFAAGLGNSGATMKALETQAGNLADQNYQQYYNDLGSISNLGASETNSLVGAGENAVAQQNQALTNNANAQSATSTASANNITSLLKGLGTSAASLYKSSYSPTTSVSDLSTIPYSNMSISGLDGMN